MDPDETAHLLLTAEKDAADSSLTPTQRAERAQDARWHREALQEWKEAGGFPPTGGYPDSV